MVRQAGLNDTLTALILVYVAQGLPMAIFILSEFIQQIPKDLRDRGALRRRARDAHLPRSDRPSATPGDRHRRRLTMVPVWNDLWFPLLLTSSDSTHTITLGVQQFSRQYMTDWNQRCSPPLSLAILPVVAIYVIFSRQLISGLTPARSSRELKAWRPCASTSSTSPTARRRS